VRDLQYRAPTSVEEAVRLLAEASVGARLLAGGTDLLIQLRDGMLPSVRLVVDGKRIAELGRLSFDERSGLRLGAAVPCYRVSGDGAVALHYPSLAEAAQLIGSRQIQSRATVGGNLCNGSPAADAVPALIALGARAVIAGPRGRRELAVEDFITGPRRTALADDELLIEVLVPPSPRGSADCYQRFIPRNEMDIAVVGVGASVALDGGRCTAARIALGAVGPTPILAEDAAAEVVGKTIDEDVLERVAEAAIAVARPISDKRGPAEFRRRIVGVLTRRVVAEAARRAAARD
jgi:aerobic carbon-monoxide dehydrogenase medium subunit